MSTITFATRHAEFGQLALQHCDKRLPLAVLSSAAGFYIGTCDDEGPCSRESREYWRLQADADKALATGDWKQKSHP